jgi:hypothetical protein
MEIVRIKPGKPMDDATWIKYLRQGNVPGKLAIKGKAVISYDLKFILVNQGPTRGNKISANILFGNYFNENLQASSIAIVNGTPFKTESIVCFINPPYETVKKEAVEIDRIDNKDGVRIRMAKEDRRKLATDFLTVAKGAGRTIAKPIKAGASIHLECSFIPVPKQPYFILQIDREERNESDTGNPVDLARKAQATRYMQGFTPQKQKPNTDILDRIKAATPKKGKIEIDVTPEMAEDILTLNTGNRQMTHDTIFSYASDMQAGKWMDTGDSTMSISSELKLLNAQHRLMAQIKSGATIHYTISTGIHPDAFKFIDAGRSRTGGDTLSVRNLGDPNQASATVTFVLYVLKYNKVPGTQRGGTIHNNEIDEWINMEGNLRKLEAALKLSYQIYRPNAKSLLTQTMWTALLLLFSMKHKGDAELFMEKLATFESIGKETDSPIWYCRKYLESWRDNKKNRKEGIKAGAQGVDQRTRAIITAWNHFREKDGRDRPLKIEKLKIDPTLVELPKISR